MSYVDTSRLDSCLPAYQLIHPTCINYEHLATYFSWCLHFDTNSEFCSTECYFPLLVLRASQPISSTTSHAVENVLFASFKSHTYLVSSLVSYLSRSFHDFLWFVVLWRTALPRPYASHVCVAFSSRTTVPQSVYTRTPYGNASILALGT